MVGFFILSPKCINFIEGDETSWEGATLATIARCGQLMAFKHAGFWQAMDTLRDKNISKNYGVLRKLLGKFGDRTRKS